MSFFRQCGNLFSGKRCTLADKHTGPCDNVCWNGARARQQACVLCVSEVDTTSYSTLTSCSKLDVGTTYNNNVSKNAQRASFTFCALKDLSDTRPVIYLDAAGGGCTKYFLSAGIDSSRLRPFNNRSTICTSITQSTSVPCVCDDINNAASMYEEGECSIAWFDMTGKELDLMGVAHVAEYLQITLSTRAEIPDVKLQCLRHLAKSIGLVEQEVSIYRGNGNKMNMINALFHNPKPKKRTFWASSGEASDASEDTVDACFSPELAKIPLDVPSEWIHTALRVPFSRWTDAGIEVDWSSYQTQRNTVHAIVVDLKGDKLVLAYLTKSGRYIRDTQTQENRCGSVTTYMANEWLVAAKQGKRKRSAVE